MDVSQDEYNLIIRLLEAGKREGASSMLIQLTNASEADAEIILNNIIEQENIIHTASDPTNSVDSLVASPPPPTLTDLSPVRSAAPFLEDPIAAASLPASEPSSQVGKIAQATRPSIESIDSELEDDEELETPLYMRILPAVGLPLFIVSITAGILAIFAYFFSKLFIKNKGMEPAKRWTIVGVILAFPYIIYFGFIHFYSAPYEADRTTKVELPKYLIESGTYNFVRNGKSYKIPIVNADVNHSYADEMVDLKIIAIGFHESADTNTNIIYYDPVTLKKLDYPFTHAGKRVKFESVIKEQESMFDVKKTSKHTFSNRHSRLMRIVYTCNNNFYIKTSSLVERETNRLVTNETRTGWWENASSHGLKTDLSLKCWHAAKWDLYVEMHKKPCLSSSTLKVTSVSPNGLYNTKEETTVSEYFVEYVPKKIIKFELPYMEHFELDPDEDNLFDLKIPYCKIMTHSLKAKIKSKKAKTSKEGSTKAGQILIET